MKLENLIFNVGEKIESNDIKSKHICFPIIDETIELEIENKKEYMM